MADKTGPLVKTGNEYVNLDDISTAVFEDGPSPHLHLVMKTNRQHGFRGPRAKALADFLASVAEDLTPKPPAEPAPATPPTDPDATPLAPSP